MLHTVVMSCPFHCYFSGGTCRPSLSCGHCVLTHCCVLSLQSLYAILFFVCCESCFRELFLAWFLINAILVGHGSGWWLGRQGAACALHVHRLLAVRVKHKNVCCSSWRSTLCSSCAHKCIDLLAAVAVRGARVAAILKLFHSSLFLRESCSLP